MSGEPQSHTGRATSLVGQGGSASSGPTIDVHAPIDVASIGLVLAADLSGHNVDPRHFLGDIDLTPSHTPIPVSLKAYFPASVTATYALDGRIEMERWGRPMALPVVAAIPVPTWSDPAHALPALPPWEVPQWKPAVDEGPHQVKQKTKERKDIAPPPGSGGQPHHAAEIQHRAAETQHRAAENYQRGPETHQRPAETHQRAAEAKFSAAAETHQRAARIAPPLGKSDPAVPSVRLLEPARQPESPQAAELEISAALDDLARRRGASAAATPAGGDADSSAGARAQPLHAGPVHDRKGGKAGAGGKKKSGCLGCLLWLIVAFFLVVGGLIVVGVLSDGGKGADTGSDEAVPATPEAAPLPAPVTEGASAAIEAQLQEAMRQAREAAEVEVRAAREAAEAAQKAAVEDSGQAARQTQSTLRREAQRRRAEAIRRRAEAATARRGVGRGQGGALERGGVGDDAP